MSNVQPGQPLDGGISARAWNLARELAKVHDEGVAVAAGRTYYPTQALPRIPESQACRIASVPNHHIHTFYPSMKIIVFPRVPEAPEQAFLEEAAIRDFRNVPLGYPTGFAISDSLDALYGLAAVAKCRDQDDTYALHDDTLSWIRGYPYWHRCHSSYPYPVLPGAGDVADHMVLAHGESDDIGVDVLKLGADCHSFPFGTVADLERPANCRGLVLPRKVCIRAPDSVLDVGCVHTIEACSAMLVVPHPDDDHGRSTLVSGLVVDDQCAKWEQWDAVRNGWSGPILLATAANPMIQTIYYGNVENFQGGGPLCSSGQWRCYYESSSLRLWGLSIALCPGTTPAIVDEVPVPPAGSRILYDLGAPIVDEEQGTVRFRILADARTWCDQSGYPYLGKIRICVRELCVRYRCDVIASIPGRWYEP